jgi:hypothetical protein
VLADPCVDVMVVLMVVRVVTFLCRKSKWRRLETEDPSRDFVLLVAHAKWLCRRKNVGQ